MLPVRIHLYNDIQDQIYCAGHATHEEIGICVSSVLKHFLRSTPSATGAHNERGQSLSFLSKLKSWWPHISNSWLLIFSNRFGKDSIIVWDNREDRQEEAAVFMGSGWWYPWLLNSSQALKSHTVGCERVWGKPKTCCHSRLWSPVAQKRADLQYFSLDSGILADLLLFLLSV